MKYKVGDKLVFDRFGIFQECEVVNVLEKTSRYRIKYPSTWKTGTDCIELKDETKLFVNINDCVDSKINELRVRIVYLQSDIQNWEQKRTKGSEAK